MNVRFTLAITLGSLIFIIVSAALFTKLLHALAFYPYDFTFYMQSYALLSGHASVPMMINTWGYNMFGMVHYDGYPTVHHDIHFSPIKYLFALIYRVFPSPVTIIVAQGALYAVSFTYIAWAFYQRDRRMMSGFRLIAGLALCAGLSLVSGSVTVYVLLPAMIAALMVALTLRRPDVEIWAIIALLGVIREEAFALALFASLILLFDDRRQFAVRLMLSALLYLMLLSVYFLLFIKFSFNINGYSALLGIFLLILVFLLSNNKFLIKLQIHCDSSLKKAILLTGFCLPFFLHFALENFHIRCDYGTIKALDPKFYSLIYVVTAFLFLMEDALRQSRSHNRLSHLLIGVSVGWQLVFTGINASEFFDISQLDNKRVFWDLVAKIKPDHPSLIVDDRFLMAFYNEKTTVTWRRLPIDAQGGPYFYPDNAEHLKNLISQQADFIFLTVDSHRDLSALLNELRVTDCYNDTTYYLGKSSGSKKPCPEKPAS